MNWNELNWIEFNLSIDRWMDSGKCADLKSIDLDASDNLSEDMLLQFLDK